MLKEAAMNEKKIMVEKEKVLKTAPALEEVIRGTFREVHLKCMRKKCKCHKAKKYRHGPFYRIGYGKGKTIHTVYVPKEKKARAKKYTDNYNRLWEAIERISELNIQLLKAKNGRKK